MTQQLTRCERIEDKIDRTVAGEITVTADSGGTMFRSMNEVMEFAKLMSVSDVAIPKHLRGNPGACMAVCLQAIEWRMSPFAVANKSYVVSDRVSFESQLIHAVIEMRAPIEGRLRFKYSGEGNSRRCTVWATAKGEAEPLEFTSSTFGEIQPKNSPLWKTKPDLQLFYNASRDWARAYFPEVILGVYSNDELDGGTAAPANGRAPVAMPKPVSPLAATVVTTVEPRAAEPEPTSEPEADTGAPDPIPYQAIIDLFNQKRPDEMSEGEFALALPKYLRGHFLKGQETKGKTTKALWELMGVEAQVGVKDALDADKFPWVDML